MIDALARFIPNAVMKPPAGSPDATLILMASARSAGNTAMVAERLLSRLSPAGATLIDLTSLKLRPFDYERVQDDDGFRDVIRCMIAHPRIVLATPVYWYALSGPMKTFFDRLTDLLLDPDGRPLGRALAGRQLWLLATGTDEQLPPGFEEPFARTAAYFAMHWRNACYIRSTEDAAPSAKELTKVDRLSVELRS